MSQYIITIETDNAAFDRFSGALTSMEGLAEEVSRILRELADEIKQQNRVDTYRNLIDFNGNKVGQAVLELDEEGGGE